MEATSKVEARKHNIAYIVRICCIAALGGILLGYDTAVISGAIGPIRDYFGLSPAQTGWAVSSVVLGSIIGAVSAGWAALKYGRRNTPSSSPPFSSSYPPLALHSLKPSLSMWFYVSSVA
ncbi:MFS transporter [Vibrio harveyi]|nr:MFS transporter [Vibrio harveyi]